MYPVWKEKVREYLGRPICYFSSLFNFQLIAKLNFKKNRKQNDWKFTANRGEIKMATKDRFRVTVKAPWTEFSLSVLYFHSISIQFPFNFHSIEWKLNVTEKTTWVNLMFYRMKVISNIIFSLIYEIPEYIYNIHIPKHIHSLGYYCKMSTCNTQLFYKLNTLILGGIHKLRWQARGRGEMGVIQMSTLFHKLSNEGESKILRILST